MFGPFNGGSRVLVDQELQPQQLWTAVFTLAIAACAPLFAMLFMPGLATGQALLVSTVLAILAVGYTVPPLRLSYRTLGEFTVGLTHSLLVILCGYIYQNGDITNQKPWLISLPLFLSILPSITMSNVPDRFADRRTSKKTIAVRFGANAAA